MTQPTSVKSFNSKSSSLNKLNFQTKYKKRGTNQIISQQQELQNSNMIQSSNTVRMRKSQNYNSFIQDQEQKDRFYKTSGMLSSMNFSHHDKERCACGDCLCGRHLCKLNVVKPDLRKSSTYMTSFRKDKLIRNQPFSIKQQSKSLPKVQMNSTYSFSFRNKQPNKVQKNHPIDELIFDGPSAQLSTYKVNFPGQLGKNPYVRPRQIFAKGDFPIKNRISSYKDSYGKLNELVKTESGKINDQLQTGNVVCFRQSFYRNSFRQPNPQDYQQRRKVSEKHEVNPDYTHQYQSTYLQDFVQSEPTVCPAKIKMQTKINDLLSSSKGNFNENSDFKAMSSQYRALSMAPRGQYS